MSILSASGRWPKIAEVNERGFDRRFKRVFYRHGYNRLRNVKDGNCICLQRSCYDEGKRVSETLAFDYVRMQNVDIRVARIFNTYGPGSFEGSLEPQQDS